MYRFSLGKITVQCPQCGRRTFKPYVDNATGMPLDACVCGRCNREFKCGYHYTPTQWFAAGGKAAPVPVGRRPAPLPPPDFINPVPEQPLDILRRDALFAFLCGIFGEERVLAVFRSYHVIHANWHGGATTFFLTDECGNIRSAKLMRYGSDGHRIKSDNPAENVTYLHTVLGFKQFRYRSCFFGAHLAAAYSDRALIVVESEKTAIIMACADSTGRFVFMACGGASAIRPRPDILTDPYGRFAPLKGREVILYPDADMVNRWDEAADALRRWCRSVYNVDITASPYFLTGSDDIADYILRRF